MDKEQIKNICGDAIRTITTALGEPLGEAISKTVINSYNLGVEDTKKFYTNSQNIINSIWIDAQKEEPKELSKKICIYHPNFRDGIIICDEYRPSEQKFYYYDDGESYSNIPLAYPNLKWTYIENLIPSTYV